VHHIAGAFRFAEYDFFKRWAMRLIAWEKGIERESVGSDLELTDWPAVEKIAQAFHHHAIQQIKGREGNTTRTPSHDTGVPASPSSLPIRDGDFDG
jgi:hypothetical protein